MPRKKGCKNYFWVPLLFTCPYVTKNHHNLPNSAANKYYSSASHHEQKNKKTTGQCIRPSLSASTYRVYLGNSHVCYFTLR